ncbi:MAG: hypothetical protein JJU28_08675 [Cyclobacteriaceae bacterium]|nr:hypothetical protein [Cyclobacteriaceae bacterium]
MAGLKYYERTKLLIELIEKKKTGGPKELAKSLGLKERMIYNVLDDLRLTLGCNICYCKEIKSYVFTENNEFTVRKLQ